LRRIYRSCVLIWGGQYDNRLPLELFRFASK
jgi:hypothetical protein